MGRQFAPFRGMERENIGMKMRGNKMLKRLMSKKPGRKKVVRVKHADVNKKMLRKEVKKRFTGLQTMVYVLLDMGDQY